MDQLFSVGINLAMARVWRALKIGPQSLRIEQESEHLRIGEPRQRLPLFRPLRRRVGMRDNQQLHLIPVLFALLCLGRRER